MIPVCHVGCTAHFVLEQVRNPKDQTSHKFQYSTINVTHTWSKSCSVTPFSGDKGGDRGGDTGQSCPGLVLLGIGISGDTGW